MNTGQEALTKKLITFSERVKIAVLVFQTPRRATSQDGSRKIRCVLAYPRSINFRLRLSRWVGILAIFSSSVILAASDSNTLEPSQAGTILQALNSSAEIALSPGSLVLDHRSLEGGVLKSTKPVRDLPSAVHIVLVTCEWVTSQPGDNGVRAVIDFAALM